MEVLYINEQVKNENGLIVRSGKFGPFESCAEIDYFINFKREKDFMKSYSELQIERVNIQKETKPQYYNKYTNEQLGILLKRELSHLSFLNCEMDVELQRKTKILEVFSKSVALANKSCDKKVQTKVNKVVNYYLTFKIDKNPNDLDFELKKVPNEVLNLLINFNKKQEIILNNSNFVL